MENKMNVEILGARKVALITGITGQVS